MMALLMSLLALSIDAILPALSVIGESFGVGLENPNDNQLLLSSIFFGMVPGLMIYGPLSDSFGRKKIIYFGVGIFAVGTLISLLAADFTTMLAGRFIQGFGAASCRVVSIAMIRDRYEGREMAKIMSFIAAVFIVVPAIAPSIGQGILLIFGDWNAIFIFVFFVSLVSVTWLSLRQRETLAEESRSNFSFRVVIAAIVETVRNPVSFGYTVAAGLTFGSFVGYLSSAQQILQFQYHLGDQFSLVFGGLALAIGVSSYLNTILLKKFSMENLCLAALSVLTVLSLLFISYTYSLTGQPPTAALLLYLTGVFFALGILFGNFNALALEPLGHIAGTASSVIASLQTLISVFVGGYVGYLYNGTIAPLVLGFLFTAGGALLIAIMIESTRKAG